MKDCMLRVALSTVLLSAAAGAGYAEESGRVSDTAQAAVSRAVVSGACTGVTEMKYKSDDTINKTTSSSSFVNLPNGDVTFTQGGIGNGCVIVTFTAEGFARLNRRVDVRARLDNAVIAAPRTVWFSGDDDEDADGAWARAHAFTFIFPSVAPGAHTVRMQFRSGRFSEPVFIHKHTVVVQHR